MKERPILFSAPMVRAILDGRKTQTRRVVKPQPYVDAQGNACWNGTNFGQDARGPHIQALASPLPSSKTGRVRCPFGKPGDRLWVRETFQPLFADGVENHWETDWQTGEGYKISYPATDGVQEFIDLDDGLSDACKPSIHMPRWASRILLEITAVRVERLNDISEDDAIAEGTPGGHGAIPGYGYAATPGEHYHWLWESINGAGSWDANPWVWVIEFKKVGAEQ